MNKDEAEKCLDLAFSYYNKGNYEKVAFPSANFLILLYNKGKAII